MSVLDAVYGSLSGPLAFTHSLMSNHSDNARLAARDGHGAPRSTSSNLLLEQGCPTQNHNRFIRLNNFLVRLLGKQLHNKKIHIKSDES